MIATNEAIRGNAIVRPDAGHAQRTGLIWRRVAWAFGLLVLTMLPPLAALAQKRTSAWQTQTIPEATVPAPTPAAAPAVHVPPAAPPKQLTPLERQAAQTIESQAKTIEQQKAEIASRDSDLDRAFRQERRLRMDLRMRGAPVELFPPP